MDWEARIRRITYLTKENDDVGKAGETELSRLADEIARASAEPQEALEITKTLCRVGITLAEETLPPKIKIERRMQLAFLAQYVPALHTVFSRIR